MRLYLFGKMLQFVRDSNRSHNEKQQFQHNLAVRSLQTLKS